MSSGRCADQNVHKMRQAIRSFGFTTVVRGPRIFVLWPGTEEILICRQLERAGYWELNKVDRNLWEKFGAIGIPIFEFIVAPELIKWMYEKALDTPEVVAGLAQTAKESGAYDAAARATQRYRERDYKAERARAKKRKQTQLAREANRHVNDRQEKPDRISPTGEKRSRRQS